MSGSAPGPMGGGAGPRAGGVRWRAWPAPGAAFGAVFVTAGCMTPATQVNVSVNADVRPTVHSVFRVPCPLDVVHVGPVSGFDWAFRAREPGPRSTSGTVQM